MKHVTECLSDAIYRLKNLDIGNPPDFISVTADNLMFYYAIYIDDAVYVGKTIDIERRLQEHIDALTSVTDFRMLQCFYDSHNDFRFDILPFIIIRNPILEACVESAFIKYFKDLGYRTMNAMDPLAFVYGRTIIRHSQESVRLAAITRSNYYKERNKIEPGFHSKLMKRIMNRSDVRSKVSEGNKRWWSIQENAERMRKRFKAVAGTTEARERNRLAQIKCQNRPEVKAFTRKCAKFGGTIGYAKRYEESIGMFKPWMHFGINKRTGKVTVWAWDTRIIQFTCHISDLPSDNYVPAKDNYEPLISC